MTQFAQFKGGHITGTFAPAFETVISIFQHSFPNLTITVDSKLGDLVDPHINRYDGCVGQLQNNLSDTYIPLNKFPLIAPRIDQGYVILTSSIVIGSGYNNTVVKSIADVMDSFHAFSGGLWWTIAATITFFIYIIFIILHINYLIVMRAGRKFVYVNGRTFPRAKSLACRLSFVLRIMFGALIKQHTSYNIKCQKMVMRMMILLLSIFTFIISLYFSAMIKTEKVVTKMPDTISSYQDIVDRPKVRPVWANAFGDHFEFRDARRGSLRHQIWQQAIAMGVNNSFFDFDINRIHELALDCTHGRSVWLGPAFFSNLLLTNACAMDLFPGMNAWIRSDTKAEEWLFGLMKSSFMPNQDSRLLDRVAQEAFEHRLMDRALKQLDFIFANQGRGSRRVRECMANRIIIDDNEVMTYEVHHYRRLIGETAACLVFASLILIVEKVSKIMYHVKVVPVVSIRVRKVPATA